MSQTKCLVIDIVNIPKNISIDQLYILYKKDNGEDLNNVDPLLLELLQIDKYIKITDYIVFDFELRAKGHEILEKNIIYLHDFTEINKNEVREKVGIESWIDEYRKIFKSTGASGKIADKKSTIKKMEWFFKEYPEHTDKDKILRATQKYIDQEAHNQFKYLQRCDYFISKEDTSKIKMSRLASFCEEIEDNYEIDSNYRSFNKML